MTLEQLTEVAESFGIKVRRNASLQSIIYDILDAQADKRGAEVQAKEDAKQAKAEEKKRNKRARIQAAPTKVNTDNMKSNRVLATVGNEQETLGQMKEEQAKQPQPKPVISAVQPSLFETASASDAAKAAIGRAEPYEILDATLLDEEEMRRESEKVRVGAIREVEEFHGVHSADDRTRCFIKVQDGCNYFCTYCTIPYARGKSRNPKIEDVVKDAQEALNQGAKELIITGVNIGDFGRSTGESFIELLRALDELGDEAIRREARGMDYRVRISSCEPNLLTDEIIDFVAQSKHFAPHFHIPLQSGSNEVLKIMKRRYTRELFAERVRRIKELIPHAFIGVDCMVGVRGETEAYWEDYLAFIKGLDVSQLHVFTYSERANTKMLEMDLYVVPKKERQRRSKILHEVSEEKTKAFYEKHAGRKAVVLWEAKKEGDQMSGFTENYIKVYGPYNKAKINTFEAIRL